MAKFVKIFRETMITGEDTRRRLLLCKPHMSGRELPFVEAAIAENWAVPMGPQVDEFERELEEFLGTASRGQRVVALSAGTAAIHLALLALGIGAGDEVLCQSMTFCASCNPVAYVGATPVFIDSEADTWNMDPALLEQAIEDRIARTGRKPRAIILVHLYGMPAKLREILAIAEKYDIPVIEDAAEAFGARYNGRPVGTFGDYGILSFNGNKMITTSGGGALVVPDAEEKRRIMFYATQAREGYPYYQHEEIGYNYRLSNISACIGLGQMTVLDEHLAHHRRVNEIYAELLADVPGVTLHRNPSPEFDANFWLSTVLLDPELRVKGRDEAYAEPITGAVGGAAGVTRAALDPHTDCEPSADVEALRLALQRENIESRPLWKPMHRQPVFSGAPAYVNGTSEGLFARGLCLPSGPDISRSDCLRVVQAIGAAIER